MDCKGELYPFHKANIHEDRLAARVCRAFPLAFFVGIIGLVTVGVFYDTLLLLLLCAIMNLALWLWLVTTCLIGIAGTYLVQRELERSKETAKDSRVEAGGQAQSGSDSVQHLIVIPNYKEPDAILEETLQGFKEAQDSHLFHVVLAMEAREEGSLEKGTSLQAKFQDAFAKIDVFVHPTNLDQLHNDGTRTPEVPGKASNLRWAVGQAHTLLQKEGRVSMASVMVTVADADCIFHPGYFSHISREFNVLRNEKPDKTHEWTMWQAPQLSFRNHWGAPICSRAWTYVSSMYEFGGVTGLHFGGHHMVFSGYSLPLQLARQAESWDGDTIAEDHHCFLKNFFYSVHTAASGPDGCNGCEPMIQVRPVFLPVKSTPVISGDGFWASCCERWHQAKRHAQGVAELSYCLLATYDAFCTLPLNTYSVAMIAGFWKVFIRLMCMHMLPICQAVGLGVLTIHWAFNNQSIPMCPKWLTFEQFAHSEWLLCGLAGTWTMVWPVVIPMFFLMIANYCFITSSFIAPAQAHPDSKKVWYRQDGNFEASFQSKRLSACFWTFVDCIFFLTPMMVPYGFIAMLVAIWNVAFYGNDFNYIVASKQASSATNYGAMDEEAPKQKEQLPESTLPKLAPGAEFTC